MDVFSALANSGPVYWTGLAPVGNITLTSGTIGGLGKIAKAVSVGANATISPGGNLDNTYADYERHLNINLAATYEPREYIVQYHESDLDFVSRLLEAEGIT